MPVSDLTPRWTYKPSVLENHQVCSLYPGAFSTFAKIIDDESDNEEARSESQPEDRHVQCVNGDLLERLIVSERHEVSFRESVDALIGISNFEDADAVLPVECKLRVKQLPDNKRLDLKSKLDGTKSRLGTSTPFAREYVVLFHSRMVQQARYWIGRRQHNDLTFYRGLFVCPPELFRTLLSCG